MNLVNILNNGTNFIRKKVLPYALAVGMGLGGISCGKEKSTSPDYDVPENLKLLQTEQVVSFENETLIFSKPTEQTRSLKQGDIIGCGITSETPHGLLRRITSISKDKKIIKTESVTLADVAKDYHIEFDKELTSEDIVSVKLRKGVLESKRNELLGYNLNLKIDNVVLYDLDKNENTTFDQIVANGNIGFNSHLYITCKAEDWELKHFDFKNIINEKVQLKLNSNTNSGIINKEVQIAKYSFPPMTVGAIPTPIGPIPIIITPKISINVGINGNTPTLKTDVTQDAEVTAGVSYKNGQWNDLSNLKNIFEFKKPEIYGDTNIKFYAGPQLNLMVYDFAGPYAELNAHLRFEVDMSQENLWELYGGLEAKLGAEIEIFSHKLADYESTVINKEKLLTKGGINFEIPEDDDFTGRDDLPDSTNSEDNFEWVELANDDGSYEYVMSWVRARDSSSKPYILFDTKEGWGWQPWANTSPVSNSSEDNKYGFAVLLTPPSYPFKIQKTRIYFKDKNATKEGFYLHIWDESNKNLIPNQLIIPSSEINVPGWWEKDVSDYDIKITSGKIKIGMCQKYLPDFYVNPSNFPDMSYFRHRPVDLGVDIDTRGDSQLIVNGSFENKSEWNFMMRVVGISPK